MYDLNNLPAEASCFNETFSLLHSAATMKDIEENWNYLFEQAAKLADRYKGTPAQRLAEDLAVAVCRQVEVLKVLEQKKGGDPNAQGNKMGQRLAR